jgi:hypothetical protein
VVAAAVGKIHGSAVDAFDGSVPAAVRSAAVPTAAAADDGQPATATTTGEKFRQLVGGAASGRQQVLSAFHSCVC